MERLKEKVVVRNHLAVRLNILGPMGESATPSRGWIRAIRDSLGMTSAQLAQRLGISQPSVTALEQSEATGRVQLDTLRRAAEALNCRLVYTLVPNEPLEDMVRNRARKLAERHFEAVEHSMALEGQAVEDPAVRERQLTELAETIPARSLWDEQ